MPSAGGAGGAGGTGGDGEPSATTTSGTGGAIDADPTVEFVALAPESLEYPEGIALSTDGAALLVGYGPSLQVDRINLANGERTTFAGPSSNGTLLLTALAQANSGTVFATIRSKDSPSGIYGANQGGTLNLYTTNLVMPLGVARIADGDLLVADGVGTIARFFVDFQFFNTVSSEDELAPGAGCPEAPLSNGIGASAIAVVETDVYVTNASAGSVLKFAGGNLTAPPLVLAGPSCELLGGASGVAATPDGSIYVSLRERNAIVKVQNGAVETLASGGKLAAPAHLVAHGGALYIANSASLGVGKPSILKLPL